MKANVSKEMIDKFEALNEAFISTTAEGLAKGIANSERRERTKFNRFLDQIGSFVKRDSVRYWW